MNDAYQMMQVAAVHHESWSPTRSTLRQVSAHHDIRDALVELQPRLRRFGFGLCGSLEDADDLVQAAYERALRRLEQWPPATRLDCWMFRNIQTIFLDRAETQPVRAGRRTPVDPDSLPDRDVLTQDPVLAGLEPLNNFITALPVDQRAAVLLVTVERLSYRDAAQVLSVPVGSLVSRLSRGRAAFANSDDSTNAFPEPS